MSYVVGVVACPNATNLTDCSTKATAAAAVMPGPPAAPAAPTVTYNGDPHKVTLTWTAPTPSVPITSYRVTPSLSDNLTGSCTGLVSGTTCDYAGLGDGLSYTFKLTAIGPLGSSAVGAASAPKIAAVPNPVDTPTVTRDSDTAATVSWTKPVGGAAITGYTVRILPKGGAAVTAPCKPGAADTLCRITSLTATQEYTFTVEAVGETGGGTSGPSSPSNPIIPGVPAKPGVPVVELGDAPGKVTVRWSPSTGGAAVTSYTVKATSDGAALTPQTVLATVTRADFSGLQDGKAYTFTVTATNATGSQTSDPSDPIMSQLPGQPANVKTQLGTTAGKVVLTWDAPVAGGPVNYYTVASSGGTAGTLSTDCGFNLDKPSCEITNLDPASAYTFTVTAVGDLGVKASEPTAAVKPAKPGAVATAQTALTGNAGEAKVSWTPPATGGAVASYTVTATAPGENPVVKCDKVSADLRECLFTGLNVAKSYTFQVSADNPVGGSVLTAAPVVGDVPSAPRNVKPSLKAGTPGTVKVEWTAPVTDKATQYVVTAYDAGVATALTCATTELTCDVPGLSASKPYTFVVRASNPLGYADAAASAALVANQPGAPTAVAVKVTGDGTVDVTWSPPLENTGGAVDTYDVLSIDPDEMPSVVCPNVATGGQLKCSANIGSSIAYKFKVEAVNKAGRTPSATTQAVLAAAPGTPAITGVALGANDPGTVIVSWSQGAGGGVDHYMVTATPADNGSGSTKCTSVASTATSCTLDDLREGTSYTFVVSAVNDVSTVPSSSSASIRPDKPGIPVDVTAVQVPNQPGHVKVTWAAPVPDTGGAVDHYEVTAVDTDGNSVTGCANVAKDAESLECPIDSGLNLAKRYTFHVAAVNVAGSTVKAAPTSFVPDKPAAPASVNVTLPLPGTAVVTWPASTGGAATKYVVSIVSNQEGEELPGACTVDLVAEPNHPLECHFPDLNQENQYTFTITASNTAGTSAKTSAPFIPNRPNPPGEPDSRVVSATEVRITWSEPDPGGPVASYTVNAYAMDDPETEIHSNGCTNVTKLECVFGGLDPTKTYQLYVVANGPGGGVSENSIAAGPITTAPPGKPGTPTVEWAGPNAVRVTWMPNDKGGPVEGFWVDPTPNVLGPSNCSGVVGAVEDTDEIGLMTCYVDHLISGTTYTFKITARGTADRTVSSESSLPIVAGPPDTPERPTVAPGSSNTEVSVSWTAPTSGVEIAGYTVIAVPGPAGCTTADTSCTVKGLDAKTKYRFRVQANGANDSGDSAFSPASEEIAPAAPGKPSDVAVAAGDRQIAVSWTAPASITAVTKYEAKASPGGASCQTTSNAQNECVITGLSNLTTYRVTVTAVGADASSAGVMSGRVRPTSGAPGAPTGVTATAGNKSAVVNWVLPTATGDGIAYFTATATNTTTGVSRSCVSTDGAARTCTVTGLEPGGEYRVAVVSVGRLSSGNSAPASAAATVRVPVPPAPPSGVTVTQGARSLIVTWKAAAAGNGLSGYTATATGGTAPLTCTATTATATTCTIAAVNPGTSYVVKVVSNSTSGVSSDPVSAEGAVTGVSAVAPAVLTAAPTSANTLAGQLTLATAEGVTTVSGTGFNPYTGITVNIGAGTAWTKLATAVSDANGKFSVPVTLGTSTTARTVAAGGMTPSSTTAPKYQVATVNGTGSA
ncbi:fibronectin type III domain-containing protein [Actinoplanes sp. NPDC048796]|uniref:fibronectin type III domain-containing protein n=1 Tax=Actinoplanes sp. NPDC048796 TaxID=3155640 RepID=UPI0033CD9766